MDQKVSKKGYRIHKPSPLIAINFDRPHPEYESGFVKLKRSTFDPRPLQGRTTSINWNELISMSHGNSSVLCFKNFTSNITSDYDYQLMPVSSPVLNPYTLPEIVDIIVDIIDQVNFEHGATFLGRNFNYAHDLGTSLEFTKNRRWVVWGGGIVEKSGKIQGTLKM